MTPETGSIPGGEYAFSGRAAHQPAPSPKAPPQAPPTRPKRRKTRSMAFAASLGLHGALLLLLWGLGQVPQPPKATEPLQKPIEVSLLDAPQAPQPKAAPPAPHRLPVPKPMPKAIDRPRPAPAKAAAPRRLPPRPAVVAHKPAPHPANRHVTLPKHADLHALLQKSLAQGSPQEAQQLAALQARAIEGQKAAAHAHAAGARHGAPTSNTSGLSGQLASRTPLHKVDPHYPPEAEQIGDSGEVRLRLWVKADGAVGRVEVVRSSGRFYFDREALRAIRQWIFNALPDKAAPDQYGDITLNFNLR